MLTRQRAAVTGDELCRLLDEDLVAGSSAWLGEREVDAHVHAAVAEVTVRQPIESMIIK